GGLAAVVAIDSLTGDILYSRMTRDDLTMETRYDDFREISGVRFPFHATVTSSMPLLNSEEWVQEVQVNAEVSPGEFRISNSDSNASGKPPEDASFAPAYRFPEGQTFVSIPFEYENSRIFVTARINSTEPVRLLLDSGAGTTTLTSEFANRLGLKIHGEIPAKGVSGYQSVGIVQLEEIDLGEVALLNQTVAAIDIDEEAGLSLQGADGIIGYELLNQFPMQIDFTAHRMTLYNPGASPEDFPGESFAIGFESKVPTVKAVVGKFSGEFLLDLGNSVGIIIHNDYAQEIGLDTLVREQNPHGVVSGVGGRTNIREYIIPEFSLGGFTFRDLAALVMEAGGGMASSESLAGNIGTPFLDNFLITIDYRRRQIWLQPLD
ncbi:MAG: aspartyl protease family protein, partial [Candidatus Zixiibacteriota bacterium]